jgi:hypothetical protein
MRCSNCGHENPKDSRFCNSCGSGLTQPSQPQREDAFGIFYFFNGQWTTSFELSDTEEEALDTAARGTPGPDRTLFLGYARRLPPEPNDDKNYITDRLKVVTWHRLVWRNGRWVKGTLAQNPGTIIISSLEKG